MKACWSRQIVVNCQFLLGELMNTSEIKDVQNLKMNGHFENYDMHSLKVVCSVRAEVCDWAATKRQRALRVYIAITSSLWEPSWEIIKEWKTSEQLGELWSGEEELMSCRCHAKQREHRGARIIRRVERRHQNGRWMRRTSSHPLFSLGHDDCGIDAACKLSRATNFTLTTIDCRCLIRGGFWQLSQSGLEPKSFTLTLWLFAPCRVHIAKLYGVKNPQIMRAEGRAICFQQACTITPPNPTEPIGNDQ